MISKKAEWALRSVNGSVIVCEKVCPRVLSTFSFFSCNKGKSCLVDETPREKIYDN